MLKLHVNTFCILLYFCYHCLALLLWATSLPPHASVPYKTKSCFLFISPSLFLHASTHHPLLGCRRHVTPDEVDDFTNSCHIPKIAFTRSLITLANVAMHMNWILLFGCFAILLKWLLFSVYFFFILFNKCSSFWFCAYKQNLTCPTFYIEQVRRSKFIVLYKNRKKISKSPEFMCHQLYRFYCCSQNKIRKLFFHRIHLFIKKLFPKNENYISIQNVAHRCATQAEI